MMNTSYPTPIVGKESPGQVRVGDFNENGYILWLGSPQEAPLYTEIYRAALLHELYLDKQDSHEQGFRVATRSLGRIIGDEARRLWDHLFGRRNN